MKQGRRQANNRLGQGGVLTTFGSVCSGIEAASVAWHPLGWKAAWLSEIEPFPCAVLAHHYPDVPNLGDMTLLVEKVRAGDIEAPDVFTGGTPCQAFSVAGKRQSLNDARGNLSLTFCEIADAIDDVRAAAGREPSVIVWENVPGVLSTTDNAFGCFLGALAGAGCELQPAGGRWTNAGVVLGPRRAVAWRVLDAQYFGLAQRRRRVFVVASARDGFDPAAVLFEFDGVRRDSAPSREARQTAPTIPARSTAGGGLGTDFDLDGGVITMAHGQGGAEVARERSPTLTCNNEAPIAAIPATTNTLRGEGFNASEDGTGRGTPLVPVAFAIQAGALRTNPLSGPGGVGVQADHAYTLEAQAEVQVVAFPATLSNAGVDVELSPTLGAHNNGTNNPATLQGMAVRRITPVECERLQGFPDGWTAIPYRKKPASECPDGPRYRALGNSWAVPVVRWIGRRIQEAIA